MKPLVVFIFLTMCIAGSSLAYAQGYGKANPHKTSKISSMNLADMDKDGNGSVNFEEFKAVFPNTQQAGFNMLDSDEDGQLNKAEWKTFKDAHKGMGSYKQPPKTTE